MRAGKVCVKIGDGMNVMVWMGGVVFLDVLGDILSMCGVSSAQDA